MTRDDILLALRLTAMGRAGHPLQEELADKLAAIFQTQSLPEMAEAMRAAVEVAEVVFPTAADPVQESADQEQPKRTRKAKAH